MPGKTARTRSITGRQWSRSSFQRRQLAADDQAGGAGDARDRAQLAQQVAVALEPGVAIARRQRAAPLPRAGRRQADDREDRHLQPVALGGARHLGQRGQRRRITRVQPDVVRRRVGLVQRHDQRDVRGAERDDLRQQRAVREADVLREQPERDAALPVDRRGRGGGGDGNVPVGGSSVVPGARGWPGEGGGAGGADASRAIPSSAATRIMTRAPAAPRAPAPP